MDPEGNNSVNTLPVIPHIEIGTLGADALAEMGSDQFQSILRASRRHYGSVILLIGDFISRRWLASSQNPYEAEIASISSATGAPGVFLLNLSYEWSCTSSVTSDPCGIGSRMLRTLDWPLEGLGRNVVVAKMRGAAGVYENITWPGFTGVVTAMAPGRFSAAINQPPMRRWSASSLLDWVINRYHLSRNHNIPPVHLLRQIFDECNNYDEAKKVLIETPIAMPAFFTLSGTKPGENCIIEREENNSYIREGSGSIANHWIAGEIPSRYRGFDSQGRYKLMEVYRDYTLDDFSWVRPPILNLTTRIAVIANAGLGFLAVQGWEACGPATKIFYLTKEK